MEKIGWRIYHSFDRIKNTDILDIIFANEAPFYSTLDCTRRRKQMLQIGGYIVFVYRDWACRFIVAERASVTLAFGKEKYVSGGH